MGEVGEVGYIVPWSEVGTLRAGCDSLLRVAGCQSVIDSMRILRRAKDVEQGEESLVHALDVADAGVEEGKEVEDTQQGMPVALSRDVLWRMR